MKLPGLGFIVGAVIIIAALLAMGFDTVDASHKGVKVKFGEVIGTMDAGIKWTGLFVDVYQYNLRTRKLEVVMTGNEGAVDKDGQSVFARIEVNYRMIPVSVEDAYKNIGTDNDLANVLNIDGIIREGFKSVTSKYSSLEIFQKRQEVKDEAITKIESNFPKKYFMLENVVISNIDFNPDFKAAIESKKVAEETAKAEQEKVKIAMAQADIKIATAEGDKQKVQLEADANAYQILKQAEAEAEALKLKRQQLTPLMVQNNWVDAWNGQLPKYMLSDGSNFLFEIPNEDASSAVVVQNGG